MIEFLKRLAEIIQSILEMVFSTRNWLDEQVREQAYKGIQTLLEAVLYEASAVMPQEIEKSYLEGLKEGAKEAGGVVASTLALSDLSGADERFHVRYIQDIQFDTMNDLQAAIRTAQRQSVQTIEQTLEEVRQSINSGLVVAEGQKFIREKVSDAFVKEGLTSFITSDNKKLPLDYYTNLVVNTKVRTARVEGKINELSNNGIKFGKITNKLGTCPICARYKGLVVAFEDNEHGFPVVGRDVRVVQHPHCRCFVDSYHIDIKNDDEIKVELIKWQNFNPEKDPRTIAQKRQYNEEQERKRKLNEEKKQWMRWSSVLQDYNFKTLGAFRRSKRANSPKFQELQKEYISIMRGLKEG